MSMYLKHFSSDIIHKFKTFTDHESRHNSNRVEADSEAPQPAESTPLLQHFPQNERRGHPLNAIIVSALLIILIVGVMIGIYLLVLQNESGLC